MPLKGKGCSFSSSKNTNPKQVKFLTEDQVEFICNKVNAGKEINSETIQQGMNANLSEINTYKNAMLKESEKNKDPTQIEKWSILSDHVRYVMHGESEAFHKLNIDLMNYRQNKDLYKMLNSAEMLKTSVKFGGYPE